MLCRLCNNDKLTLYYRQGNQNEFKFYKCNSCGLVNYDILAGLNQEKYGDHFNDPFDETLKINIDQKETFRYIKRYLKPPGKAFEIGCGNGKLLSLLKNEGWSASGLELSPLLAQSIGKTLDIDVDVDDFLKYNPPNNELFDIVVLRHVLEHLIDPLLALMKINSFLKLGGRVILEFPNIEGFDLKIKRFLQRNKLYHKKYANNYKPGHCNEFSYKSFERLAAMTGFQIEKFETYSHNPIKNFIYNRIKIGNKARTIIRKVNDA